MSGYDAVVFDSDGVLVEPPDGDVQADATRAAFAELGIVDPDRRHVDDIVAGVTVERLREICDTNGLDPATFWEARERHDERSQVDAFEAGKRDRYDDVTAVEALSPDCGIVSNNHHTTIGFVLEFFDLRSAFDVHYGREKTVESLRLKKPEPHYLDRALADLDAASALYVGDSESDVVAADRAGIDSAFVRRPHCRDADLTATPTYEVTTLHDVSTIMDG